MGRHFLGGLLIFFLGEVVVGPDTQFCTLLEVWVLGVGMLTLDA